MAGLNWCFKQEKGLKLIEPNENLAEIYLKKSQSSLNMLESAVGKKEFEWILNISYYAKYFCVYAVLTKLGIKCEIHDCTIKCVKFLVEEGIFSKKIWLELKESKDLRIGALYYNTDFDKQRILKMAERTSDFCLEVEEILENLNENKVLEIHNKLK